VEEIIERRADYTRLLINPCFANPSVISQLDQFIITNCLTTFSTNDEMYEDLIQNRKPSRLTEKFLLAKQIY